MKTSRIIALLLAVVLTLLAGAVAQADEKAEAALKVDEATMVLRRMMPMEDAYVTRDLLKKAKGVAIFPGVFKAGFILGGQGGSGMIMARTKDGWTAPAFYTIGGASVGLQFGASSTDLVLVIMTDRGLKGLINNQVQLGGEISLAMGPIGVRTGGSYSAAQAYADIYTYSMSAGFFGGVSLDGSGLGYDVDRVAAYYGKAYTPAQILLQDMAKPPESAELLISTLEKYLKQK